MKYAVFVKISFACYIVLMLTSCSFGEQDRNIKLAKEELSFPSLLNIGHKDAPVKMIVFVDYKCSYTTTFFEEQFPVLIEEFINKKKLQMSFKSLPLSQTGSLVLSQTSYLMNSIGEFPRFLENQYPLSTKQLEIREQMPAAIPIQDQSVSGINQIILEDIKLAKKNDIKGTPTFIINGLKINGLQSLEVLLDAIRKGV